MPDAGEVDQARDRRSRVENLGLKQLRVDPANPDGHGRGEAMLGKPQYLFRQPRRGQGARRRTLGEAGRARVMSEFSWERAAQRVAGIHSRVASHEFGANIT
jgi:hypothetical protein